MTVLSSLAQLDILPDLRNMAWAAAGVGDARDAARPPGWPDAGKRAAKAFGAQLPCSQLCRAIFWFSGRASLLHAPTPRSAIH